jgi:hypothetical protein
MASSSTASTPARKPTITPSITNGQRMNQLVAPTSFITSTSRRRANTDRRIVFAINAIEANTSSAASPAPSALTRPVADRISSVSRSRLRTSSTPASRGLPPGARSSTIAPISSGSSGVRRNRLGNGLLPSSSIFSEASLTLLPSSRSASSFEMYSTDLTPLVASSCRWSSARSVSLTESSR